MENNGNDIFDPIDTEPGADNSSYVPRFERDLQKMGGNLNALADAKKAEQQAEKAADVQNAQTAEEPEDEEPEEIYDYIDEPEEQDETSFSTSPYHSAPMQDDSFKYQEDNYCRGKTVEQLIRENEEQDLIEAVKAQKLAAEEAYRNLEDVRITSDMLSDMGYNYKQQERKEKRQQQEFDELAKEIGGRPKLQEMSDEIYASAPLKKASTFDSQEALGRDEKQLIKERLQKEIDSRPKGINKKNSAELYKSLMHEQKVKRAKKGLFALVLMALGCIISSVLIYSKLNPDDLNILIYVSMGGVIFALLMLLKASFFRITSCIYFSAEAVFMVYTCVNYSLNTERKPDNYFETLIYFIVVIAVCAIVAIQLATNANIDAFYTTSFSKKNVAAPSKGGSRRQRKK